MTGQRICRLAELAEQSCREFELQLQQGEETVPAFVLRLGDEVVAYRNRCPHTGATLNWMPDDFLSTERDFIQCAIHGALFRPRDGFCLYGPCAGRSLQPVSIIIEVGVISTKAE
jgi:nitrite reductase/ring-hydroxylating ferredoxin subunit